MKTQRLLKLKHERRDLGFLRARLLREDAQRSDWNLLIESPADLEEFREHLSGGSSIALAMVPHDGEHLRGEACVASISEGVTAASVVKLSGIGPLRCG